MGAKDKGCLGNLSCAELPDSLDVSWAQVKYFDFQLSTSMATFPHLVLLHAVFSLTTWDGSNGAELQERFLNISFVPPSPNLLAAVGACQGGRCPGVSGGAISSPAFPLNYPDKTSVEYQLETYRDSRIRLQFEVFDLEEAENCRRADFLRVFRVSPSSDLGAYCGKELPGPFTSEGNTMVLRFESDILENRQGFLATWTEVPPTNLIEGQTQGEFKTPNYPNKYPRRTKIVQTFSFPDGAKVEFKVVDFQTERCCDRFCINSPNGRTSTPQSQCFSGRVSSIPTFEKDSKSRYFTLSFHSDGSVQQRGFNIQWKLV